MPTQSHESADDLEPTEAEDVRGGMPTYEPNEMVQDASDASVGRVKRNITKARKFIKQPYGP